jgi:dTMP kinase
MKYHLEFDVELLRNPHKGLYIAFEGIDGSGKTSQIEKLKEYFESKGRSVVTTREPRKEVGLVAELNKKILEGKLQVPRSAFQYLFTADRIMHLEELVIPSLKEGKVVITDRCFWSAIPYGAMDNGKEFNVSKAESLLVAQGVLATHYQVLTPDITLFFDISIETSLQRMGKMTKTKEVYEDRDILTQVILGYKWLQEKFPDEFSVINAETPIEEVTRNMVKIVEQNIALK